MRWGACDAYSSVSIRRKITSVVLRILESFPMASLHLNQLRASSTMKTTGEAIPRQSARAFLGNSSHRQAGPSQSMTDFRTGENFNHLKLTAEKMMQEQAGVKSDLQILKSKLQKAEEQVRTLESKIQDMNNENATIKVKHKQDMKLWMGLDSKFLSTTAFCDQLAETLQLLDSQVQEGERSKNYLDEKLVERLEFFEYTECRLNELLSKKEIAEDSVKQCEASNVKLQSTIREMEETFLSDSVKFQNLAVEKDDLQQLLTKAIKINEDNEAVVRSARCEIQELQTEVKCKAKEATHLQHLNLTLMQDKGELELEVKGLQSLAATRLKESDTLQHELEVFKLKITELGKVNALAAVNIENLLAEISKLNQQSEEDKISQEKLVNELRRHLVETKEDVEIIQHQLLEAIKENETLVKVVGENELKSASLLDEINRLCQECTEKSQLILCKSHNEESLRREITMIQGQLTAAENSVKGLEVKFNLQLQSQQEESSKNLQDVSRRNDKEMAETRRKYEAEIKDAIAKEILKISNLRQSHHDERAKLVSSHSDEIHKKDGELHRVNEMMSKLRESNEEEKMLIVSVRADEIHRKEEELSKLNEKMIKLREGYEKEKAKIHSMHAHESHNKEEELHKVKERISELEAGHEKENTKIVAFHAEEIHKRDEELHKLNERISELEAGHEKENPKIVAFHAEEIHKKDVELHKLNERISELEAGHEKENTKTVAFHAKEIHKNEVELHKLNERISELEVGHEQEKAKIVAFHAEEIRQMQEGLHTEKKTHNGNIAQLNELQQKFEHIRQFSQEEMEKLHQDYRLQLQKITEEKSRLHEVMKEMQLVQEEELMRTTHEKKAQLDRLEKDQQAEIKKVQNSLTLDINQWKSKALEWESQLKETLQQTAAKDVSKEDEHIQISNEDFKMTVTEGLVSKDTPTAIVTPITKDKEPQKQNKRLSMRRTIHLEDTTDEDAEEESRNPALQGKGLIQRGPRPRKRKVDVVNPPEDAPRVNGKTSRRKGTLDVQDKNTTEHHQGSTDSTKPTEDGSSGNKQIAILTEGKEPQQQNFKVRQHLVAESRRRTGFTSTQESDLHPMPGPMPGPTNPKGTRHDVLGLALDGKKTTPKQRVRKSTKDVSQVKNQFTKALSPAISDLFQMDGLVPYYKGDDPYAFD